MAAKIEMFRQKLAQQAGESDFENNLCKAIVYISMDSGNSIDEIMHWPIRRFYVVLDNVNKINKEKNGPAKSGSKGKTLG